MAPLSQLVEVGFTWDGGSIPAPERSFVTFQPLREGLSITVEAPFYGDPPPSGAPASFDGLWAYEVVEVFITGLAPAGKPTPYLEIELSPHGHHLVLDLLGERQVLRTREDLSFHAEILGAQWRGQALIPWNWLPSRPNRFNVYGIHGVGDERRYLAMAPVPGAAPDFHQLAAFAPWPF